jgi:hypothetical protein
MKILLTIAVLVFLVPACCPCSKGTSKPAVVRIADCDMVTPWQLRFVDGSGNQSTFSHEAGRLTVRYEPMTAAESSSGVYDGGRPFSGTVSEALANRILESVRALAADPQLRVARREMGTGQFTINVSGGKECRFLIARGEPLEAFVSFLKSEVMVETVGLVNTSPRAGDLREPAHRRDSPAAPRIR